MSDNNTQPSVAYITSHLMPVVANYLNNKPREEFTEADKMLEAMFAQQAILITAVNSTPEEVRKTLGEALDAEVTKLGETPEPPQPKEEPSNLIVPDRFKS